MENQAFVQSDLPCEGEVFKEIHVKKPTKVTTNANKQKAEELQMYVLAGTAVLIIAGMWSGGILATGIYTGVFTFISMALLLFKLKENHPRLWNTIIDNSILADGIFSAFIAFILAGGSVTGIISASVAAILTTFAIKACEKFVGKAEGHESYNLKELVDFGVSKVKGLFKKKQQEPNEDSEESSCLKQGE